LITPFKGLPNSCKQNQRRETFHKHREGLQSAPLQIPENKTGGKDPK
jgi:hypothetical protein